MNIDWFTFGAQVVNFVLLVYLLNRFLYGPIMRAMKQRQETVASRLQHADRLQNNAEAAEERYRELSQHLEHQRTELFEQARVEAEATRKSLVAEARTEVHSRRDDWLHSLRREQGTLINLVRQRATQQVVAASRGALSQLADAELEEQTLISFLKHLSQLPAEQSERLKQEAALGSKVQLRTAFDIEPLWQKRIRDAIGKEFSIEQVTFVTSPDLICGVELYVGGSKIGWSMREYFESLTDELQGMLAKEE